MRELEREPDNSRSSMYLKELICLVDPHGLQEIVSFKLNRNNLEIVLRLALPNSELSCFSKKLKKSTLSCILPIGNLGDMNFQNGEGTIVP